MRQFPHLVYNGQFMINSKHVFDCDNVVANALLRVKESQSTIDNEKLATFQLADDDSKCSNRETQSLTEAIPGSVSQLQDMM